MSAQRVLLALVAVTAAVGLLVFTLGSRVPAATGGQIGPGGPATSSPTAAPPATPTASVGEATPVAPPTPPTPTPVVKPTLDVVPRAALPGGEVMLAGKGFRPLERIGVGLSGAPGAERALGEVTASDRGELSGTLTLPVDLMPGRHVLRLRAPDGGVVEAEVWAVGAAGYLDLPRYAVHPGEALAVAGGGFAPGEAVQVYLAGSPRRDLASLTADDEGAVAGSGIVVPEVAVGLHLLVAEGAQTGVRVERQISVLGYTPWIVLSTYALRPGGTVEATGHDFAPGETVHVTLDQATSPAQSVAADDQGRVLVREAFAARPEDVGSHRLKLVGERTRSEVSAAFEVLGYVPRLALEPYAGPPGSTVAFSGDGFAPGETVRVYLERGSRREEVGSIVAGRDGVFQGAGGYVVPSTAEGELRFVVVGDLSRAPVSQSFDVQPEPAGG